MKWFFIVFVSLFYPLSGMDLRQREQITSNLEFLPKWCAPSFLFLQQDEIDPKISVLTDQSARPISFQNENGERVSVSWLRDRIDQVVVYERDSSERLSLSFCYDQEGNLSSSSLKGNLTGKEVGTYTTELRYDEENRLVERVEQNGRKYTFSYPTEESDYFVVTDTGLSLRKGVREEEGCCEEIEDDGTSLDIFDLSDVSWRTWLRIKALQTEGKISKLFGAYDPAQECDHYLRRELFSENGTKIFDAQNQLVSVASQRGCYEQIPLFLNKKEFFAWKQRHQRTLKPVPPRLPKKRWIVKPLAFNARGMATSVLFTDGREENEYSLSGHLVKKRFPDGSQICYENDIAGRPLVIKHIGKEGVVEDEISYTYKGKFLFEWTDLEGNRCCFERDLYGRVVHISFYVHEQLESEVQVSYDALDRPTYVLVCGVTENWWMRRSFSVDGAIIEHTIRDDLGNRSQTVRETRGEDGVLKKKEETQEGQALITVFDDQERVVRTELRQKGKTRTVFWKEYEQESKGNLRETTLFDNKTRCVLRCTPRGEAISREWFSPEGKRLIEERMERHGDRGSFNLVQKVGGKTRSATHLFDDKGRLKTVQTVEGNKFFYSYDAYGRTQTRKSSGGRIVHYHKDEKGRVERIWSEDRTVDYQLFYDDRGRIARAVDGLSGHEVSRTFDLFGRLCSDGEKETSCSVSYTGHGEIASFTFPDSSSLSYGEEKDGGITFARNGNHKIRPPRPRAWPYSGSQASLTRQNKDPYGTWQQKFSFDSFQQVCKEEGEFNTEQSFSPAGALEKLGPYKAHTDAVFRVVRAGPVRAQYDLDGNMIQRTNTFGGCSYEYDALGRLTRVSCGDGEEERYRYDAFDRLQEIVKSSGEKEVRFRLMWFDFTEIGAIARGQIREMKIIHPKSREMVGCEIEGTVYLVDCDERGSVISLYNSNGKAVEGYRYSAFGQMHGYNGEKKRLFSQPKSPWLYCGKRKLFRGYDFGARRYDPVFLRWFERDPFGIVDAVDDRQFVHNNPVDFFDPTGLFSWPVSLTGAKDSFFEAVGHLSSSLITSFSPPKSVSDWFSGMRAPFEDVVFSVLSKTWFSFAGYNPDSSSYGVCGKQEENPGVRITLINGMLNCLLDAKISAQMISKTHGDTPVHFVYSATEGFTGDMVRAFLLKVGVTTKQSELLAQLWRRLIQEMGGSGQGSEIIHYAHSLGSIETRNALQMMTPEERKMIRVITFGSPALLPSGICSRVENFVSAKDGIPFFDYRRHLLSFEKNYENIYLLHSESSFPFVDHLLEGKTYRTVLEVLGQEFQERYRQPFLSP